MAESLGQKQRRFALMVSKLIAKAYAMGYEISLGDAYRDPRVFGEVGSRKGYGRASSLHKQRLAIDLNLFKPDATGRMNYVSTTEGHRDLGEWWEAQGGSWGGRFNDGNHYSLAHGGRR